MIDDDNGDKSYDTNITNQPSVKYRRNDNNSRVYVRNPTAHTHLQKLRLMIKPRKTEKKLVGTPFTGPHQPFFIMAGLGPNQK